MKNSNSSLSRRALLVSVNVSRWVGRKHDKRATNTVAKEHKNELSAGSYSKKLLPGAGELEAVNAVESKARQFFYLNTLPWLADGTRIISAKNHLKFSAEIRKMKSEFESKVKEFVAAYPKLKIQAEKSLGDLFESGDYPESIDDRFSFEINYLPMPDSKDFRIAMSDLEKQELEEKLKSVEIKAMRDVYARLQSTIKSAAEKLGKPGAIFRDSLLENITEMTAMLPMLNISDDLELYRAASEINKLVGGLNIDVLRGNESERESAAMELSRIEKSLGAFMGVNK